MKAINLKCDLRVNPIGLDVENPRLSWELVSEKRRSLQTAYRIIVSGSVEALEHEMGDLWDTGRVEGSVSIHVPYEGKKLSSQQKCYWSVGVWDESGAWSGWSEAASFEMGLLNKNEWKARWICRSIEGADVSKSVPAPLFRKQVMFEKQVVEARAYICGLGYYELYINGKKIGNDVLSPPFTRYDKTLLYQTYDVSEEFSNGENVIGAILGNGWYNSFTSDVWDFDKAEWRHHPKLLLQIHVLFKDGTEELLVSDTTWKSSDSPIVFDSLKNGEYYDARLEQKGWYQKGFDDSQWERVFLAKPPGGSLKSMRMPPIRIVGALQPVNMKEVRPGVWVYDFGQNLSGWGRLKVEGPKGTEVVFRYAEKINEDGSLDPSNINVYIKSGEFQTDKYILKGEGLEIWHPRFTYHGFQYIEVTGFPGVPDIDSVTACIVHTDLESKGSFECSNELLNSIQRCARWSTLTNYHSIPTDCPQREKNGWTGDANLSAEQVLLNFDPALAYEKWLNDFIDAQRPSGQLPAIIPTSGWGYNWGSGPAWDSAIILVPWWIYLYKGDSTILMQMFKSMEKYMEFMTDMSLGYILDFGLGDWCPPEYQAQEPKCPTAVSDTAYYYLDACVMGKAAGILGYNEKASYYEALAGKIREAFRKKFIDFNTGNVLGDCQTSVACALYNGFVNDDEKPMLLKRMIELIDEKDGHLDCGILGAKYLLHTLTELGRADIAYGVAVQDTYPSWGYWIRQGATTLWETWEGNFSRNHHMFSDISAWFYRGLAGIQPDPECPGFKHIIIKPNFPEGLQWVNASHKSMYGEIKCCWRKEAFALKINISVPVNCRASVYLPCEVCGDVMEGGIRIMDIPEVEYRNDTNGIVIGLGSGAYLLEAKRCNFL